MIFEGLYTEKISDAVRESVGQQLITDKLVFEVIGALLAYACHLSVHTGADQTALRRVFTMMHAMTVEGHKDCARIEVIRTECDCPLCSAIEDANGDPVEVEISVPPEHEGEDVALEALAVEVEEELPSCKRREH